MWLGYISAKEFDRLVRPGRMARPGRWYLVGTQPEPQNEIAGDQALDCDRGPQDQR